MSRKIKNLIIAIIVVACIPLLLKIADFSRFVIITTGIHELLIGIFRYYFKNHLFLSALLSILILFFLIFCIYKTAKRRLYSNYLFLSGLVVFIIEILPFELLRSVKPQLLMIYIVFFFCLFIFLTLKKRPFYFLESFFNSVLLLFPVFALFLFIGFNATASRPKKTILNGGPEHNIFDERCDRKRLLSQREIKPIWLEDAWLYGGVATKDGRYIYFLDNGYGIVGFKRMEDGSYEKLPYVKYPLDFDAALYSHRLYLTPDEKYLYYYGARSAEFVFIDRERLEVAYVIPTKKGLDGFSATMDNKRNLIYGFPFIGKEIPVLLYEDGIPRLIKWIDFSQIPGWAIQGVYIEKLDKIIISTSSYLGVYNPDDYKPISYIWAGPVLTRWAFNEEENEIYFSNEFSRGITLINLNDFKMKYIDGVPPGIREIFFDTKNRELILSQFSQGFLYVFNIKENRITKKIYAGQRPRGALLTQYNTLGDIWIFGTSCGIFSVFK